MMKEEAKRKRSKVGRLFKAAITCSDQKGNLLWLLLSQLGEVNASKYLANYLDLHVLMCL